MTPGGERAGGTARNVTIGIIVVALAIMIAAVTLTARPTIPRSMAFIMAATLQHPLKSSPAYAIDAVEPVPSGRNVVTAGNARSIVTVRRNQGVSIVGWAYDAVARRPARGVLLRVDGEALIDALYGTSRPDVASTFGNAALKFTGFVANVPAGLLAPGLHHIDLIVLASDGTEYSQVADRIEMHQLR